MQVKVKMEGEAVVGDEPVSPTGQYFNSSALSVAIIAIFESDVPIDDSLTMPTLENLFLPVSPRFSSIMVEDEQGVKYWKRVKVKLEDHVNIPTFPRGLKNYDEYVQEYITKIANDELPPSQPLWEMHLIKYPTSKSEGTMVFKLHHALGDGFSLMGALFSCVQRADDPSLSLTFPSQSKPKPTKSGMMGVITRLPNAVSMCLNTVRDFGWSLLKSSLVEDDRSAIRSGTVGVEFQPVTLCSVDFSLDDIFKIKAKIGVTVNDVISGIIFYGIQLYIQAAREEASEYSREANITALMLMNTRIIGSYLPLNEMNKPDAKSPWGNQFGFIHVAIPSCKDPENAEPLQFVLKARQIIMEKKNSLSVLLTGRLLEILRRVRGPEGTAKYIHSTLRNTSMTISSLIGPMEKMIIAGHPVRSLYFMVAGAPQSLTISALTYTGKLTLAMGVEKGFIDPELITSCMNKSFERIFEDAIGSKSVS